MIQDDVGTTNHKAKRDPTMYFDDGPKRDPTMYVDDQNERPKRDPTMYVDNSQDPSVYTQDRSMAGR